MIFSSRGLTGLRDFCFRHVASSHGGENGKRVENKGSGLQGGRGEAHLFCGRDKG